MKKFLWLFVAVFALSNVMFMTSCNEDDVVDPPVNDTPPTVAISNISSTIVDAGTVVTFTITADKGTNDMNSMKVTVDGTDMSTDNLSIDEYTTNGITLNNPQLLTGADVTGFVYNANITIPGTPADYVYEVVVNDNKAESASDFFTVTAEEPAPTGTELSASLSGILFNQAGPSGTGGLDLDEGVGMGSSGMGAEIRDMGIDTDQSVATNWRQQMGPANDATMVVVDLTAQPEGFSFATVEFTEQITAAYDTGLGLPSEVNSLPATDIVEVGDMFAVQRAGVTYLIRVTSVDVTSDNNDDSYTVDIKY